MNIQGVDAVLLPTVGWTLVHDGVLHYGAFSHFKTFNSRGEVQTVVISTSQLQGFRMREGFDVPPDFT